MLLVLGLLFIRSVLNCAARREIAGVLAGIALVAATGTVLFPVGRLSKQDIAIERQALDARGIELMIRVALPGSALACLSGRAGETVESSCEKLLFASPETTAAAVSYVSAQLALLADYASLWKRAAMDEPAGLVNLRRVIEADRFGLVAQALAGRDGCTPSRCEALALLRDASRVRSNLGHRTFDFHVARYAPNWPSGGPAALAAVRTPAGSSDDHAPSPAAPDSVGPSLVAVQNPTSVQASAGRPLRSDIFLPSAASIPPVSIMSAEPAGPEGAEPSGAKPGSAAKSAARPGTNSAAAANPSATSARRPVRAADEALPREPGDGRVPVTASAGQ